MASFPSDRAVEWRGGSLDELIEMLRVPALAARIEVLTGAGGRDHVVGEVHVLAGGVAESTFGAMRDIEALERLRRCNPTHYRVEPRLPHPDTGALDPSGPEQGSLSTRPLPKIMRYCEEYVMTCLVEVWRGEDHAAMNYRRGELTGTTVNGVDAPERLPEVLTWSTGNYHIVLPPLVLPAPPPQERPARPSGGEMRTLFGVMAPQVHAAYLPPLAVPPVPIEQPHLPQAQAVSPPPPAAAIAEASPRDTQSMIPAADERGTMPGLPVAIFDHPHPERITDVGLPRMNLEARLEDDAPEPPRERTTAQGAPAFGAAPSADEYRRPSTELAAVVDAPADPASISSLDLSAQPPPSAPIVLPPPPRRQRVVKRSAALKPPATMYDLPVAAHVGIGLLLGLAAIAIYWLANYFLTQ